MLYEACCVGAMPALCSIMSWMALSGGAHEVQQASELVCVIHLAWRFANMFLWMLCWCWS